MPRPWLAYEWYGSHGKRQVPTIGNMAKGLENPEVRVWGFLCGFTMRITTMLRISVGQLLLGAPNQWSAKPPAGVNGLTHC